MASPSTDVTAGPRAAAPSALATCIACTLVRQTQTTRNVKTATRCPLTSADIHSAPMHLAGSPITQNVLKHRQLLIPLLLIVSASFVYVNVPLQHSLFVTTISWLALCIPAALKAGVLGNTTNSRRSVCWLAGAFLSLSYVCDRAALDKQGIWATKVGSLPVTRFLSLIIVQALLPVFVALLSENELLSEHLALPIFTLLNGSAVESKPAPELVPTRNSYNLLAATTVCASVVLSTYTISSTFALGVSSVIFAATGLVLFGTIVMSREAVLVGSNGTSPSRSTAEDAGRAQTLAVLRDVASAIAVISGIACYFMEMSITSISISRMTEPSDELHRWPDLQNYRTLLQVLWSIPAQCLMNFFTYNIVSTSLILSASTTSRSLCLSSSAQYCSDMANMF